MTLLAYYTPYLIAVGVGLLGGVVLTSLKRKKKPSDLFKPELWDKNPTFQKKKIVTMNVVFRERNLVKTSGGLKEVLAKQNNPSQPLRKDV